MDSTAAGVFGNRATCYIYLDQFEAALSDLSKAISITPDDFLLLEKRAFAELKTKRWAEAMHDYSTLLTHDTQAANLFFYRGIAELNSSLYEKASEDFTHTLNIEPNNAYAHHSLSVCYSRMDNLVMAKKHDEAAQMLGYNNGSVQVNSTSLPQ